MSKETSMKMAKSILYRLAMSKGISEMDYANGVC